MTPEQLLQPRYKVIGDYPYCPWETGDILLVDSVTNELYGQNTGYVSSKRIVSENEAIKFPNLFLPMHWSEDIKVEDMPKYLKSIDGEIIEVSEWEIKIDARGESWIRYANGGLFITLNVKMSPATAEEYTNYINSKQ